MGDRAVIRWLSCCVGLAIGAWVTGGGWEAALDYFAGATAMAIGATLK